jgi:branched-chain amino acid transport system permease protein
LTASRPFALAAAILVMGFALSLTLAGYHLRLLNLAAISAMAVIGLNFAFGYAGLISLGHAAFVGLGAYGTAILTTRAGWPPWLAIPPVIIGTGIVATAIGYPLLRIKGHYLALATLGLNVSFYIVTANWIELTGGTNGIGSIPELEFGPFRLADERSYLWFALLMLAAVAVLASRIQASRYGRAMIAVRDDEMAAAMTGIDVAATKVLAFTLSALCAAVAGCLYACHSRFVAPEDFSYGHSITYLAMLILGGEGSIAGAILGALVLTFLPEWLRFVGSAYLACFGLLMLLILILQPAGLVGLAGMIRKRLEDSARKGACAARETTP